MSYDLHKNFGASLIAVAPVPAASGTTFSVTAGEGALFPAAPFNVVVWPAGANPTAANAEVLRVTSKGTGDNWTATRTQESSVARSIAVGDQICAAITAKMLTDIETAQAADAVNIAMNTASILAGSTGRVPGGRLTLTTALPITTADVTAATTLFYTPHLHNVISLYSGTAWADFTFPELSIAVPATTSQMYDVFVFDNAGTRTLELLAWTNDTTRATALVRQDGHWCKTGALTRLYVGSFRTTGVSGQTEDSKALRYVWNAYNRVPRYMQVTDTTDTWSYSTATWRQARATATNQLAFILGLAEVTFDAKVLCTTSNTGAGNGCYVNIGLDSTTVPTSGGISAANSQQVANDPLASHATLLTMPAIGFHFAAWLEFTSGGTGTFQGDNGGTVLQSGISGTIQG